MTRAPSPAEQLQAITDALAGITLALGEQIDTPRLVTRLRQLADEAEAAGNGASAGLLDVVAETVEKRAHG